MIAPVVVMVNVADIVIATTGAINLAPITCCYNGDEKTLRIERAAAEARRIGLMGGTFDPIHYGHLVVAEEVRTSLQLPEVVFIPAGQPPHKVQDDITVASHRAAMVELAIASNPYFTLSSVEIERPGPSYSVDTLHLLRQQWGTQVELSYIIGWDSLEELHHWYEPTVLLELITHLVAVRRPGHVEEPGYKDLLERRLPGISRRLLVVAAPQLEISATELRQRVAEGRPIKYQTPESVEQYIMQHNLYKET